MTSEVTQAFEAEHDGDTFTIRFPDGHSITAWQNGKLVVTKDAAGFRPFESSVSRLTAQSGEGRSGAGEDAGPFHVSQSGDGKKLWFSARDPASGVTIPARDRTDARNLVSSLNRACATFAALNARQSGEGEREEHLAIVECSDPNDGLSLSIKFGSGNDARDRMRAFSDRLRAGEA